jgi:hypothetical protein
MGYCHYHVRLYQFKKVLLQSLILCQLLKVASPGTGHGNAVSLQNRYYFPRDLRGDRKICDRFTPLSLPKAMTINDRKQ